MIFSVDYDLLNELGIEVLNEKENFERLLKELLEIVADFSNSWTGGDCQRFQNVAINYIKNLINTTGDIGYIGEYMVGAAQVYFGDDDKWGRKVKEIGDDYYERDEQNAA